MRDGLVAAVDALLHDSFVSCSDEELIQVWQQLETVSRKLAAVDHAVISEVSARRLEHRYGATSVPALARQVLRVPVREAKARVAAAEAAGPRVALTGEVLQPIYAAVAAAQAAGSISAAHARIVVATVDALPDVVQDIDGVQV